MPNAMHSDSLRPLGWRIWIVAPVGPSSTATLGLEGLWAGAAGLDVERGRVGRMERAQEVAGGAATMSDVARSGEGVLTESLARMEGIARMVEGITETISGLGEKSEAIGTVIRVIDDIADQTNLLALNAAI